MDLGIRLRKAYQAGDKVTLTVLVEDIRETARRMKAFACSFREYWIKDNKTEHNFKYHEVMLSGLTARVEYCADRLEQYVKGEISEIPELKEEILDNYGTWNTIWGWEF